MAGSQQESDANEPATPYKLDKARERGSIVRSAEVNFAVVLLTCIACVLGLGPQLLAHSAHALGAALAQAHRGTLGLHEALGLVAVFGAKAAGLAAPVLFIVWVSATAAAALQAGGVFTTTPLVPDFSRLGPGAGLRQLLSWRSLNELWRHLLKLAVVCAAMGVWASLHLGEVLSVARRSAGGGALAGLRLIGSALMLLAALTVVFGALDWSLNRHAHLKRMRMSKREIKDERKERDGDPRIKARLRELRLQWLQRSRELGHVRTADVLLTNPSHYAVALEYRAADMAAPVVTARGAGDLARRMRLLARLHGVPIVENPPLARALFASREAGSMVPEQHFHEVARILRWVYAARPATAAGAKR